MKKQFYSTLLLFLVFVNSAFSQSNQFGIFEGREDVGNPKIKGTLSYNANSQEYTMQGAGINMWANSDQLNFLWKKIKGDFTISATVKFIGAGKNPHRKIGVIARNQLTTGSPYADACVHGDVLTSLQFRTTENEKTEQIELSVYHPVNIQLNRSGNTFTFSAATWGENYKSISKEIALNEEVFAGLFICSHEEDNSEKAIFSNVRIIIPVAKDFRPYKDYIGSHIEEMDVATGHRKILFSAPNSIQAPNWTKDGKYLLYNSSAGLMYKLDLSNNTSAQLNTGKAINNNNDHVLSFDGKQLALSNYVGEKRISTLYTLPVGGSDEPVQISNPENGHSYLHGFSPDAKKLIFTGQRNNQYDIWTIDIASKKETQLTNTATLDDSPEYSPDGQWIYFNSVQTGTMKIWRMRPDGSNQEQVTYDDTNDWFPHFSPDGKWILYISFSKDINPVEHPWYKNVTLRVMPASGGIAKTVAFIYGGQGTINVPSWSPDSKKIAFVSNSQF